MAEENTRCKFTRDLEVVKFWERVADYYFSVVKTIKQYLSDFIGLLAPKPEGELHSWGTILGVLVFLVFVFTMLNLSTGF